MNTEIRAECQSDKTGRCGRDARMAQYEGKARLIRPASSGKRLRNLLDKARQVGLTKPLDQKIYAFNYLNGKRPILNLLSSVRCWKSKKGMKCRCLILVRNDVFNRCLFVE